MLTIIVNSGNFQPRVLTLAKEDFPQDKYEMLLKHSQEKDDKRRVLVQQILWKGRAGSSVETEWSPITNDIYAIVDGFYDPIPEWCKNAVLDRDSGYFNSGMIDTGDNEVFEVIEEDCYEDDRQETPRLTPFDTV
jgi:hypothetical protein